MKHRDAMWDGLDGIGWIFPDGGRCRAPYGADKLQHQCEIPMATFIFLHSCTYYLIITVFPAVARAMHQRVVLACLPHDPVGRGHQATPGPFNILLGNLETTVTVCAC